MANLTESILATVAGKSDAEAAAELSTPSYIPKTDRITLTTIGGAWGLTRGAEFRTFLANAAASQSPLAPVAATVLDLLKGPGFDASHPDVWQTVMMLVQAQACTEVEARAALYDAHYPAGSVVTADQVSAARAAVAREQAFTSARRLVANRYNAAIALIDAALQAGSERPSDAELLATLGAG